MASNGAASYADVHSRVRILYSLLLTSPMMANLQESTNFEGLITLLKDSVYGPALSKTEERALDPRQAVYLMKSRLVESYRDIIQASPAYARPLLTQLFRRFELDNLKAILRGIVTHSAWDQVRYVLFPLGDFTVLPAQIMLESENIVAAVEQLLDTPYYEVLSHALQRYTNEQSLFPLEVALDLDYWRKLWHYISQMPGQDRTRSLQILGPLVDLTNLMWAARYRTYHQLSEEEIINYTLAFGYHLSDEDVRAIAAGVDIAHIVEKIYPSLENINSLVQSPQHGLPILEMLIQRLLADQCRAVFTGYPFHIGLPLACLVLTELEIRDLTVLVEAKSSQMPYEDYAPYLVAGPASSTQPNALSGTV
jgi:V/A-type H+/Na+-transporting ATPase subunit C